MEFTTQQEIGMGRHRIGTEAAVIRAVRLPGEMAEAFQEACEARGETESEVIRKLIARWLRQRANIQRSKKETP